MADIIEEFRKFVSEVGLYRTVGLLIALAAFFTVRTLYRDHRRQQEERAIIKAKEEEIARLAADNRVWRDYFFKMHGGLSLGEIESMGRTEPATPIEPKPSTARRKKRKGGG